MLYRLYKILFIFSRFTTTTIVSLVRLERVIPFILDPIFELEVIPLPVKVFHLNKHREEKRYQFQSWNIYQAFYNNSRHRFDSRNFSFSSRNRLRFGSEARKQLDGPFIFPHTYTRCPNLFLVLSQQLRIRQEKNHLSPLLLFPHFPITVCAKIKGEREDRNGS